MASQSFAVPALVPATKQQCMHGGWHSYSQFKNQGQCVRFVNNGK